MSAFFTTAELNGTLVYPLSAEPELALATRAGQFAVAFSQPDGLYFATKQNSTPYTGSLEVQRIAALSDPRVEALASNGTRYMLAYSDSRSHALIGRALSTSFELCTGEAMIVAAGEQRHSRTSDAISVDGEDWLAVYERRVGDSYEVRGRTFEINSVSALDQDGDGVTGCGGDLCDNVPGVFAPEPEVIGDGIDQDCNGRELCYVDQDGDGWGSNATLEDWDLDCDNGPPYIGASPLASQTGDCYDSAYSTPPYGPGASVNPGAVEIPGNLIDENCDGLVLCYVDGDGDGVGESQTVEVEDRDPYVPIDPERPVPPDECTAPGIALFGGDNCPGVSNPSQENSDSQFDQSGDACDECTDPDGDGAADGVYPASTCALDTCPGLANDQNDDEDGDGIGDACDPCLGDPVNDPDDNGACGCQQSVSCFDVCGGRPGCGAVADDGCGGTLW
ncbi:MAG: MopE-related protein, partial [Myxococcota bacterium]